MSVGQCAPGEVRCTEQLRWSPCEGFTLPTEEICGDDLDNNCNGATDDSCGCESDSQLPCYSGPAATQGIGQCSDGIQHCLDGAWSTSCQGEQLPEEEICDGFDNDCNGSSDEGCSCVDGSTKGCYGGPAGTKDVGVCKAGSQSCNEGQWGICDGQTMPSNEACNNKEDDCDGSSDEGNPGGGGSCNTGNKGICAAGIKKCQGGAIACIQDNSPTSESCNNKDDDCDGSVDEGNPGGGASCSTGKQGVCAAGTKKCQGGAVVCTQNTASSSESCNNKDDDCDGTADEGNPGGGSSCNTGNQGICAAGSTKCQGGGLDCIQDNSPTSETCNNKDDDCDGTTDEGNPGGGSSCNTGNQGVCAAGTKKCQGGAIVCSQNQSSSSESCNNKDDDCDSTADEGNPGGGSSCNTGNQGICAAGTTKCQGGGLDCIQDNSPTSETCNNKDDNCNGSTDEGNPGGGAPCSTGNPGICSAGTIKCQGGGLVCEQNNSSTSEKCNGLDDDCDGSADEGSGLCFPKMKCLGGQCVCIKPPCPY